MQVKTYEELLEQALSLVDDTLDKREGSLIYTALAPVCALLAQCYTELDAYYDLIFADTACGEYLDRIGGQFGLTRKAATACRKLASFAFTQSPVDLTGQRFLCGDYVFVAEQEQGENQYALKAEEPGTGADTVTGSLIACEFIPGLSGGTVTQTLEYGTDGETDEHFRARLLAYITDPAFGGNQADYRNAALQIDGVGYAKIFSADTMGAGQVGIVIGNENGRPVSGTVVERVQKIFGSDDSGEALAPIGHTVTVKSCTLATVSVAVSVAVRSDTTLAAVSPLVQQAVKNWLETYDFAAGAVSQAQLIRKVLEVPGVEDVGTVKLGGSSRNYSLSKTFSAYQVPAAGTITVTEVA